MAGMSGGFVPLGSKSLPIGTNPPAGIGESGFVVPRLTNSLQPNMHKVCFDNFFSSPELLQYLGRRNVLAIGTLTKK